MKKEILSNEFCPENWDDMAKVKNGRFCSKCKINLTDLGSPLNRRESSMAKTYFDEIWSELQ